MPWLSSEGVANVNNMSVVSTKEIRILMRSDGKWLTQLFQESKIAQINIHKHSRHVDHRGHKW